MSETLEIRLGGMVGGRPLASRDLDYSEVNPLISRLEAATVIESGVDDLPPDAASHRSGKPRHSRSRKATQLKSVRLALVDVESAVAGGAVTYRFAVGADVEAAVAKITAGLAGRSGARLLPETAAAVTGGLNRTIRRGLSVQLVNGVTTPRFSASNPPPKLDVCPTRKFESEIAATLLRVGGNKPAVRVRLLGSGQDVTLELGGEKVARELGNHLYRDAVLRGMGEWVIDPAQFSIPTRLIKFKVSGHRLLQMRDVDSVIDEMTAASGGMWDAVDPTDPNRGEDAAEEPGDRP